MTGGTGGRGQPDFFGEHDDRAADGRERSTNADRDVDERYRQLRAGAAGHHVSASFLLGDTTGNGSVNASDVSQVKTQSGTAMSAANFRTDLNASGAINAADVTQVKATSGNVLPPVVCLAPNFSLYLFRSL